MLINTLAKRKLLVFILAITMVTLVYLPYMSRQKLSDLSASDDQDGGHHLKSRSGRAAVHRRLYLPFRRHLQSPIHFRKSKSNTQHRHGYERPQQQQQRKLNSNISRVNKFHNKNKMYTDAMGKLLRDAKTFRDYFHKSYNTFPWPMRKMEMASTRRSHKKKDNVMEDNKYRSSSSNTKDDTKYLIYRCEEDAAGGSGSNACGGWVNVVHGVMSSYLIASLTNRKLKLDIVNADSSPCALTDFLVPNLVDWTLPVPFHQGKLSSLSSLSSRDPDLHLINASTFGQINSLLKAATTTATTPPPNFRVAGASGSSNSYIKSKNNRTLPALFQIPNKAKYAYVTSPRYVMDKIRDYVIQHRLLEWMNDLNKTEIQSALLRFLFKPSPPLHRYTKQFFNNISISSNSNINNNNNLRYPKPRKYKLACAFISSHKINNKKTDKTDNNIDNYYNKDLDVLSSFIELYLPRREYTFLIASDFSPSSRNRNNSTSSTMSDLPLIPSVKAISKDRLVSRPHYFEDLLKFHIEATLFSGNATRAAGASAAAIAAEKSRLEKLKMAAASCNRNHVEALVTYAIFSQCDAILVNGHRGVHMAAITRGVAQGALCLSKDEDEPLRKACLS